MGRLQNKLEQLKFAIYCFKRGQDARFVRNVKQMADYHNLIYVESYGNVKQDEAVFFIDMEESHSGFFAEHNRLLALLYFADKYGMKPVVRFHPGYCYAEKYPVNGTTNPFEYYFEQPAGITLEDMKSYQRVFRSRKENSYEVNQLCEEANGYTRSETYLNEMARITARYIRLNSIVREKMDKEIEALTGGANILGVHVRGTDFKQNFNGHPVKVGVDEYLEATVRTFEEGAYDKVFLATDDGEAIEKYQKQFGEKVVFYQDVIRSKGDDTVMHSESDRENHHYLLGYEVLRDMYTLAACDGLIAGLSQVSYAARIQKKSTGKEYRHLVILDKGINYHKKNNCPA
ncbi:MAG: O-fucosyltransferase family protein [Blautia sp.]|nr:O-fucosyltransferase family protein [Blautia sp.]